MVKYYIHIIFNKYLITVNAFIQLSKRQKKNLERNYQNANSWLTQHICHNTRRWLNVDATSANLILWTSDQHWTKIQTIVSPAWSKRMYPENTRRWPNVALMLHQRLRRCPNIKATSGQRLVISGIRVMVYGSPTIAYTSRVTELKQLVSIDLQWASGSRGVTRIIHSRSRHGVWKGRSLAANSTASRVRCGLVRPHLLMCPRERLHHIEITTRWNTCLGGSMLRVCLNPWASDLFVSIFHSSEGNKNVSSPCTRKLSIVGSLRDREVACSASDLQG